MADEQPAVPHYIRVSIGHWDIDTYSPEAEHIFRQIETDGVAVFRAQPGFVMYRLMRENSTTTIAIAEWESEPLGLAGAEQDRAWMRRVGIMDRLVLETHTGQIVATSYYSLGKKTSIHDAHTSPGAPSGSPRAIQQTASRPRANKACT